jgi:hypothetical protein
MINQDITNTLNGLTVGFIVLMGAVLFAAYFTYRSIDAINADLADARATQRELETRVVNAEIASNNCAARVDVLQELDDRMSRELLDLQGRRKR